MKKQSLLIVLLLSLTITAIAQNQQVNPWLKLNGHIAYMWPSFIQLQNTTPRINLKGYRIEASNCSPGRIELTDCSISSKEALAAVLYIIGENSYGVAQDKPNIIPYKNGIIIYGYWEEKKRWELFNIKIAAITEHLSYRRFDVVKK